MQSVEERIKTREKNDIVFFCFSKYMAFGILVSNNRGVLEITEIVSGTR